MLTAHFVDQIEAVERAEWNQLSGVDYPFLRHEFLSALEKSGSASAESGWSPLHLTVRSEDDQLVAIAPCYLKDHSYGEYVFDWSWANAYHQHGMNYYPKLLTAVPFTPCVGPRLVIDPKFESAAAVAQCVNAIIELCEENEIATWHMLYPEPSLREVLDQQLEDGPLIKRTGSQFHWYNRGYETFDDYLGAMTSRKRKSIRKEREKVQEQGITFLQVPGTELSDQQLEDFYLFYHATYMKRGQHGYLNREFFEMIVESMPENLRFVFAQKGDANIATAFFLQGGDTIYGRYWGCLEEYKHLHFETCYYQGIDTCIEQGLGHFDAGAQGEHKIQRGFEPIETYSYHWIADLEFRDAIQNYTQMEQVDVQSYVEDAATYLPFKQQ